MNKNSFKAFPLLRVLMLACVPMFLLGCASGLCPLGTTEGTVQDFKNSYWRSTDKKPAKTNEEALEECSLPQENKRYYVGRNKQTSAGFVSEGMSTGKY
ncbi:hypothetical protein SAMN05428971_2942 [Candidatus Pantoea varia]|uniref:Entry exclusion lipoprotein TrbK n=1 Tax=Candidatus Pantoea varia TaxID=1881036 RepID=A0A1I5EI39_9GAMM|nr:hypothetical protein [Pantoea varia]SFO11003.1 hypothetical protein SAMN05428971_2942 [Pantoea varia]